MDTELDRGRKITLIIICSIIAISIFSIVFQNVVSGTEKIPQQAVRFILTLVLSYYLYKGANAARIIAVILYLIAGVLGIIAGIAMIFKTPIGLILLIPGIIWTLSAMFLLFSKPVKQFFHSIKLKVEKTGNKIEDPSGTWACPKCSFSNRNTTFSCLECGYSLK